MSGKDNLGCGDDLWDDLWDDLDGEGDLDGENRSGADNGGNVPQHTKISDPRASRTEPGIEAVIAKQDFAKKLKPFIR